jgi:hypothetical protein
VELLHFADLVWRLCRSSSHVGNRNNSIGVVAFARA